MLPYLVDSLVIAAWAGIAWWAIGRLSPLLLGIQEAVMGYPVDRLEALEAAHHEFIASHVELAEKVDRLPHTWEEMHHKVRRTEERTRGAVRRAMAELEENGLESPELTEIGHQLRVEDGGGSNGGGMSPMPTGMGDVPPAQPAPPDWQAATLAYKYGRR